MTTTLPLALGLLLATGPVPATGTTRATGFVAEDVLAKTRAAYAALASYADSGTVLDEATGFTNRSTFRTLFTRDPNQLRIDYRALESDYTGGTRVPMTDHVVLWMQQGDLQTWSNKTQSHETYPADGGQQVNALKNAGYYTVGISVLIPALFYSKAALPSPVLATEEAEADGFETVNGRRCFRLLGVERYRYPSGQETGVRAITLWIDAETYLIHKIVQDTPKAMPRGTISRRTTTFTHQMNPKLEPAQFRFAVPES